MLILTKKEVEFIPSSEQGKPNPVKFKVVPPTRDTVLQIQAATQEVLYKYVKEGKNLEDIDPIEFSVMNLTKLTPILIDNCVVGWENVFTVDEAGNQQPLPFSKENLKLITDPAILDELSKFIDSLAKPTEKH